MIGTIGDMVKVSGEGHIIVKRGLEIFNHTDRRPQAKSWPPNLVNKFFNGFKALNKLKFLPDRPDPLTSPWSFLVKTRVDPKPVFSVSNFQIKNFIRMGQEKNHIRA